jgi:hypothetical protein
VAAAKVSMGANIELVGHTNLQPMIKGSFRPDAARADLAPLHIRTGEADSAEV